jgi:DNA-binding SARP family transcriptional activator
VIRVDPFRESARQLLVRAYLAEGNQLEAHRQYREYRNLMRRELGMEPTDKFLKLVQVPDIACPPQGRPRPVPHRPPVRPPAGSRRQPVRVL